MLDSILLFIAKKLKELTKIRQTEITTNSDGAVQVNSATGNIISRDNYIQAIVMDSNSLCVIPYTYNNLVYLQVYHKDNMQKVAGKYELRISYVGGYRKGWNFNMFGGSCHFGKVVGTC